MDILIYGAGKYCENLLRKLTNYKNINLLGIVDSNVHGEKYGHQVLDYENAKRILNPEVRIVIAMAKLSVAIEIAKVINKDRIYSIYLFLNKNKSFQQGFLECECISLTDLDRLILPSVELQAVDFCNLNCKGCTHFSPLFERKIPEFDYRINDIHMLKEIFDDILVISILGGEPLLNPELNKYVIEVRKCFPRAVIQLVTNGLLLVNVSGELLKVLHDNKVIVSISEYVPTHKIINQIEQRLEEFQIDYSVRELDSKQKFNLPLSIVNDSCYEKKCISDGCIAVCEGKIARCPTLLYIDKFNEKFNHYLPNEGIMNLEDYSGKGGGEILLNKLTEEVPLCQYCIDCEIEWEICGKNINMDCFAKKC